MMSCSINNNREGVCKMEFRKGIKACVFPFLLFFSLFDFTQLITKVSLCKIQFNVGVEDIGFAVTLILYLRFYYADLRRELQQSPRISLIVLFFFCAALLSSIIGNPLWAISLKYWTKHCLLFFLMILVFRTSRIDRRTILSLIFILVVVNLIGVFEALFPANHFIEHILLIFRTSTLLAASNAVSSVFVNQIALGTFDLFLVICLLTIQVRYGYLTNPILWWVGLSLGVLGIILSTSRSALFSLFAGVFLLAVLGFSRKKNGKKQIIMFFVIVGLLFVVGIRFYPIFGNRYGNMIPAVTKIANGKIVNLKDFAVRFPGNYGSRKSIWHTGWEQFMKKPVLGWGTGMSDYRLRKVCKSGHWHNAYVEILVTHGFVGGILMGLFLIWWIASLHEWWCWIPAAMVWITAMFDTGWMTSFSWLVIVAWIVALTTRDLRGESPAIINSGAAPFFEERE